jgi:acyl-coenzyme A synthetase/AMP-(fatty) acid ligase
LQSADDTQRFRKLRDGLHAGRTLVGAGLVRQHRPDRVVPREIAFVDVLPRSEQGKILKRDLEKPVTVALQADPTESTERAYR